MPNFNLTSGEVVNRGIKHLSEKTNINQMADGGKARSLLEAQADEVEKLGQVQETNLRKAFLPTTSGQYLEHFGNTFGVYKRQEQNAFATADDRVFRFYVDGGGTFGSINNSNNINLTAGTVLTAPAAVLYELNNVYSGIDSADSRYDRSIHFSVTEATVLSASATEAFVAARALTPGRGGNLASSKLVRTHSFTSYTDYLQQSLKVENIKPLLNGTDIEDEASYKYRISKRVLSAQQANDSAIKLACLAIPGVSDVVIMPWTDGVGRFNVFVKSITAMVSDTLINDVQAAIDVVTASGNIGYARKPYEVGIEISTVLELNDNYSNEVKTQINNAFTVAAVREINSLSLGQTFSTISLAEKLKKIDSRIRKVGSNPVTRFDSVFVWYPSKLDEGGRRREKLITETLTVPLHSRIIAETSVSDPIRVS